MMKKIAEFARIPKSAYFQNYQRYRSQILIAQIHDLNRDCGTILRSYLQYFS